MENQQPISIMIHDLNPWGGQDRSMLEIAWQLNQEFPLEIHSYSLEGYQDWPNMTHIKYATPIDRPVVFKYLNYHFKSWKKLRKNLNHSIVQSTGTASLKSDVVQVQFIHSQWNKLAQDLPEDKSTSAFAKTLYHHFLTQFKIYLEHKIYTPEKKYIAISHTIKKELMDLFNIPEKNISIIHHGVDLKYFAPSTQDESFLQQRFSVRQKLKIAPEDIVLLHVGALNSRKGIFKSFEVLSYLKKQGFNNIKFLAVGQGDQKLLQPLIKKLDIEDCVILAPHSKDIRQYYWASDLFFFPSYYEPFGLVILEAMACGLPVVTSNTAGASELIEDKKSGILFSPFDDVEKLAQLLNPLLKNSEKRESLAQEALMVAQNHSWQHVGLKYKQFYNQC